MEQKKIEERVKLLEGGQTKAWRSTIVLIIGMLSFLSVWVFDSIVGLSDKYVCKEDFNTAISRLENSMTRGFENLDRKVDDTNKYLRDKK